jgi:hypothetical protein
MFKCDTCCHLVSDHVGPNGQCLGVAGIPGCGCERYIKKPTEPRDDGGTAFPIITPDTPAYDHVPVSPGMTLRDYFAAAAISGLIPDDGIPHRGWAGVDDGMLSGEELVARRAYLIADAMLNRRRL